MKGKLLTGFLLLLVILTLVGVTSILGDILLLVLASGVAVGSEKLLGNAARNPALRAKMRKQLNK